MRVQDSMLLWNSQYVFSKEWKNDQIAIVDRNVYLMGGQEWYACQMYRMWTAIEGDRNKWSDTESLDRLIGHIWVAVVRDGIDPMMAHRELLKVDKYLEVYPGDMPTDGEYKFKRSGFDMN
jgi:hypothetical protein